MESIKESTAKPKKSDSNLSATKKTSSSSKGKLYIRNENGLPKGEYGEGSMHLDENAYEYILHTYINEVEVLKTVTVNNVSVTFQSVISKEVYIVLILTTGKLDLGLIGL